MDTLPVLLTDTARLMRRRFDGYARSLGVTRAQWQVLFGISRNEGINQSGLAERLETENITLCRMVDRLEEAGLVERRADPGDRRAWRLYLTHKAEPIIGQLRSVADRVQAEALAGLTDEETTMLTELMARVRANVAARPTEAAQA